MSKTVLGVGLVGAGPVVQSIHVPTLLRLSDRLQVRCVMDVDPEKADLVAGRSGGRATTSFEDLLADPRVDIVAICTPAKLHADQVVAAIAAGKRGVFCEKPFATTGAEAERIAAAGAAAGTPIVVGAMHTADPGWLAARAAWGDLAEQVHTVRSRIVIPQNDRYEDWATEFLRGEPWVPVHSDDPAVQLQTVTDGILGLASHALPHVRAFLPEFRDVRVEHAQPLDPWGYLIVLRAGNRVAQLTGVAHHRWNPQWTFEAIGPRASLYLQLPPSFVHAGSAVATLRTPERATVLGPYPHDGYETEWLRLADAVDGEPTAVPPLQEIIDDLTFAVDLVEQSARFFDIKEDVA